MKSASEETAADVDAQAAAWLIKRDSGRWTSTDQAELERWLDSSTAHRVGFIRMEAAWRQTQDLKHLHLDSELVPPLGDDRRHDRRTWSKIAAVVLISLATVGYWTLRSDHPSYETVVGSIANVSLTDGSEITLNTNTEVHVTLGDKARRIEIERGEAFFQVAKDPSKPFVVKAGDDKVIAVGTAFSVRRDGNDLQVIVTEGKVRIEKDNGEHASLAAGSIAHSGPRGILLQQQSDLQVNDALSWRSGFLTFRDISLVDAVTEFNRYNKRQIVLADEHVGAIRLSGKFQFTQPDAFVRLLESSFGVRARRSETTIELSKV